MGRTYRLSKNKYVELSQWYLDFGYTEAQSQYLAAHAFCHTCEADENAADTPGWEINYSGSISEALKRKMAHSLCSQWLNGGWNKSGTWETRAPRPSAESAAPVSPMYPCGPWPEADGGTWSYQRYGRLCGRQTEPACVNIQDMLRHIPFDLEDASAYPPFAASAHLTRCPWDENHSLLLLGVRGIPRRERKRRHVVFMADVSGSMSVRWPLLQLTMMGLASQLGSGDRVSLVTYSDETHIAARGLDCGDYNALIEHLPDVRALGGQTFQSDGLCAAYALAQTAQGGCEARCVVLMTDGDLRFNIPSGPAQRDFAAKQAEGGCRLFVLGFGSDNYAGNEIKALAAAGGGRWQLILSPEDIVMARREGWIASDPIAEQLYIEPEIPVSAALAGSTCGPEVPPRPLALFTAGQRTAALFELQKKTDALRLTLRLRYRQPETGDEVTKRIALTADAKPAPDMEKAIEAAQQGRSVLADALACKV